MTTRVSEVLPKPPWTSCWVGLGLSTMAMVLGWSMGALARPSGAVGLLLRPSLIPLHGLTIFAMSVLVGLVRSLRAARSELAEADVGASSRVARWYDLALARAMTRPPSQMGRR